MRPFEAAVVAAGAAYLLVLGWAMQSLSYDIWGALVVVPILALISAPLIVRAFSGQLAVLRPWVWAGMFVKFAGAVVGYNVRFDAYGGSADAARYHNVGKELAGAVRDGSASLLDVLPSSTGTRSIEQFTGLVYTVFGSSRLGGFMVFTWLSFWGLAFYVKAAHHAVPGLATRRYLLWVMLFPSLVYWGSSIGKEAVVGFFLGITAYGAALVLARRGKVGFGIDAHGDRVGGHGVRAPTLRGDLGRSGRDRARLARLRSTRWDAPNEPTGDADCSSARSSSW